MLSNNTLWQPRSRPRSRPRTVPGAEHLNLLRRQPLQHGQRDGDGRARRGGGRNGGGVERQLRQVCSKQAGTGVFVGAGGGVRLQLRQVCRRGQGWVSCGWVGGQEGPERELGEE